MLVISLFYFGEYMKNIGISVLLLIGIIDSVEEDFAVTEITMSGEEILTVELPLIFFPCEIKEGDLFHFEYSDGVSEIRCGEPDA